MDRIKKSRFFEKWTDPKSNAESYVLTYRIAPLMQSQYFTNKTITDDGRFMWIECAYPPSKSKALALLDFEKDTFEYFPSCANEGSIAIDDDGGIYFMSSDRKRVWHKKPDMSDPCLVATFPDELIAGRSPRQTVTHFSFNSSKTALNFDMYVHDNMYVGEIRLSDGAINVWYDLGSQRHDHGQFSPTDDNVQLIAQDHHKDFVTGEFKWYKNRIWIIDKNKGVKPLFETGTVDTTQYSHEWWGNDGKSVWFVDYDNGTKRFELETGKCDLIWANGTCHSYCDKTEKFLVGDIGTYKWEEGCRVAFYNTITGKETNIVTDMPCPPYHRTMYHSDPHPQFALKDKAILYTTTVYGYITIALAEVKQFI